ncbi:MAG: HD domain-containing protein [Capsulimonadales bacterium]|nr:HD domain-containing protein [Capsulimonadales bacterium]
MPFPEHLVSDPRLLAQLRFLEELDRLKSVLRMTTLIDESRFENSAEHTWHMAMMAVTLAEYAAEPIDLGHVLKMILLHDIVEIDAGDTFAYDQSGYATKAARERQAADRLFGLLPDDQRAAFRHLWEEFEAQETPEARFAASLDRFAGMLPNYLSGGGSWRRHGVSRTRIIARNQPMERGAPDLWEVASAMIEDVAGRGLLVPDDGEEMVSGERP